MVAKTRECMDCPPGDLTYPAVPGKRKCYWHGLKRRPIEEQIEQAEHRRAAYEMSHEAGVFEPVARVPKERWPAGERWCAGCQTFVPLFYCSGSRCKAHAAAASHEGRLKAIYGIDRDDYADLLELQEGRCYVCRQLPKSKRLAVDHDHQTNEVRGLLCADAERGCNHAVLGSIEARSVDGPIPALRRLIDYLEHTPYQRLKEARDVLSERQRRELSDDERGTGGDGDGPAQEAPTGESLPMPTVPPAGPDLRADAPDWD